MDTKPPGGRPVTIRQLTIPRALLHEAAWVIPFEGLGYPDNIEGPEHPGKKPIRQAAGWVEEQHAKEKTKWMTTTDKRTFRHLIKGGNIAIVLGQVLSDGNELADLDCDDQETFDILHERFPNTLTITSRRGGHLLVSVRDAESFTSGKLEFKRRFPNGSPMTATIPPSRHVKNGQEYRAIDNFAPIQELTEEDLAWIKEHFPPIQRTPKAQITSERTKYTLSCFDVAKAAGLTINRGKALCPFHEDKHPSLELNYRKQDLFWCNGCHIGGDAARLILLLEEKGIKVLQ